MKAVYYIRGGGSRIIEAWVKAVSDVSGRRADWGFMAGRGVVRVDDGDHASVLSVCRALGPLLEIALAEEAGRLYRHCDLKGYQYGAAVLSCGHIEGDCLGGCAS